MTTTIREELAKELAKYETRVAQLRGKRQMIRQQCPELLDLEVPSVWIHSYGEWLQITVKDQERSLPELPSKLLSMTNDVRAIKQLQQGNEVIDFIITDRIDLKLRRAPKRPAKCRKAIVQHEMEFCGELPSDMELIEWIDA